ncbi:GPI transamidase component GPI16 [Euphorbia lathyris]|uniref:GPI transamidase component GPI16 n=1 Tax=Euphorbia lathyris TaxID=212925 RepID=UPI00331412FD
MALIKNSDFFLFLIFVSIVFTALSAPVLAIKEEEEFHEELLLRPLPDRKVLAHFHFQSTAPPSISNGRHHHLFPKAISQLVQKFHVMEMELSFTQGRWNYESWGGFDPISSSNAKPPGVELWAVFDVPHDQVDESWKNLTHTLSGLFCASINFLESPTMYSAPEWSFRPASGNLRHGMLPREAVCTENLTPWLKLLPCRDKAGISALMDRPSIYRGFYHSQRLHVTLNKSSLEGINPGIVLEQTLTVVLQPNNYQNGLTKNFQPSWSLGSIFGRKISGRCVLAKCSNVYLHLEGGLVTQLEQNENNRADNVAFEGLWDELGFELSVKPDRVLREEKSKHRIGSSVLYEFSLDKYSDLKPFNLGLTWRYPITWSCQSTPLHASRFLMGSGNERGAIAILLKSTESRDTFLGTSSAGDGCKLQVDVFQVVPWYVKVYHHTLQVFVNDQPKAVGDVIEKIHVSPSKDKISPGVMEMALQFPCNVKSAALTLEFDKGFLHIDEYPPDANQGFDIPSAALSFPNFYTSVRLPNTNSVENSPLLSMFQKKNSVLSYTEVLLVPLTTPDFSMPYNVITITCTVFALYFGSLLNVLRRRVGEEERLLRSKAKEGSRLSKLLSKISAKLRGKPQENPESPSNSVSLLNSKLVLKVLLVVVIAVAWQYYFG